MRKPEDISFFPSNIDAEAKNEVYIPPTTTLKDSISRQEMTPDTTLTTIYVIVTILGVFAVLGSIGNAIVVYIYSKKKEKQTSNIFILVLALIDLFTCLVLIPFTIIIESIKYHVVYDVVCKSYYFLITFNVPFSMFIMVAIAFDRYFCICHPFLHAMNMKRAKIMIVCLGLFATILGILTCMAHGVYQKHKADFTNNTGEYILENVTRNFNESLITGEKNFSLTENVYIYTGECDTNIIVFDDQFRKLYQRVYSFLFLVSFVVIAILYGLIVRFVVKRRSWKTKGKYTTPSPSMETKLTMTESIRNGNEVKAEILNKKESIKNGKGSSKRVSKKHEKQKEKNLSSNIKIAAMLFVVTLIFVITFLPGWLMAHALMPLDKIAFYMYFANHVANPVIYAFMNPGFRKDMKKMFGCA